MKTAQSRNRLIDDLPEDVQSKVPKPDNNKEAVISLVNTCLQFSGGIQKLLEIIEFYEGDSIHWQRLDATQRAIFSFLYPMEIQANQPDDVGIAPLPLSSVNVLNRVTTTESNIETKYKYHVFISHNSADKAAVEILAARHEDEAGLKIFLDKWNLIPGEPWQEGLEEALDASLICAVLLGPSGLGTWENKEMRLALDASVRNTSRRVIPVLLPGASLKGLQTLPGFIASLNWVDFRSGLDDKNAFRCLVAGILGKAPGRGAL